VRKSYRKRRVEEPPGYSHFKPAGIPRRDLESVLLSVDEYEAIRLADYMKFEHLESSQRMNISRPTFTRLIEQARYKVAQALIDGKQLIINGGNIDFERTLRQCNSCGETRKTKYKAEIEGCPQCGSDQLDDLAHRFLEEGKNKPHRHKDRKKSK
jgi:predicted DNA-binding protein (UPF0251 family)